MLSETTIQFVRASREAALTSAHTFGVPRGVPFADYPRGSNLSVVNIVGKCGPFVFSAEMAMKLVCIQTMWYSFVTADAVPMIISPQRERPMV